MNALKLAVVIALAITASTGIALNHGDVRSKADPTAEAAQKTAGKFELRLQGAGPKGPHQGSAAIALDASGRVQDGTPPAGNPQLFSGAGRGRLYGLIAQRGTWPLAST